MKKFLTLICFSFLSLNFANAELVSVGVSGNIGLLSGDGKETITGTSERNVIWGDVNPGTRTSGTASTQSSKGTEDMMIGYVSLFTELHIFDSGLRVGGSYVPYALESTTTENIRNDGCSGGEVVGSATCTVVKNKVKVNLKDLVSLYLAYHHDIDTRFVDGVFVKGGILHANLITDEVLGSGSSYGNTTLEGEFFGLGIEKNIESAGVFVRLEGNVTSFANIKMVNQNQSAHENTNTIEVTGLDGATALLSIGKSF